MSRRTTIYLVVLLVLVGIEIARAVLPSGGATITFQLPALTAAEVSKIALTAKGEVVTLEKKDGTWQVTNLGYPADPTAVEGLIKIFEKPITMDFKASEDPAAQASYELTEEQALKVELFKGEVAEVAILVGKNGPMGTNFIRPVGTSDIYRAKVGSRARFEKKAADWQDKRVLPLEPADVARLKVVEGERTLELVREGDLWKAISPADLDIDQSMAETLARGFATMRAAEILAAGAEVPGKSTPRMVLTATLKDGATRQIAVADAKDESTERVIRDTDGRAFEVRTASLAAFRKTPEELRNKSLLNFKVEDLAKLTVNKAGRRVVIAAGEASGQWQVVEPQGGAIDPQVMQTIAMTLGNLRAMEFAQGVTPEQAGLSGPEALEIEISTRAGNTQRVVIGGNAAEGMKYARAGEGPIMTLRSQSLGNVTKLIGG